MPAKAMRTGDASGIGNDGTEDRARACRLSLKTKVLLLVLGVFVAVSIPAYVSFNWIVNSTVIKLGSLFAEKQVLFDRYRGLETLMREVSLAETLGRAPAMRDWALDEFSPEKKARAHRGA